MPFNLIYSKLYRMLGLMLPSTQLKYIWVPYQVTLTPPVSPSTPKTCPIIGTTYIKEYMGSGLLNNCHVNIQVTKQIFSNLASNWLETQLPANPKPCWKILLNWRGF